MLAQRTSKEDDQRQSPPAKAAMVQDGTAEWPLGQSVGTLAAEFKVNKAEKAGSRMEELHNHLHDLLIPAVEDDRLGLAFKFMNKMHTTSHQSYFDAGVKQDITL